MNQPEAYKPSEAYWQKLASLHDKVQKHGQERSGLYWKRKVHATWSSQTPLHEDLPVDPNDNCSWLNIQYGLFRKSKEGRLVVRRHIQVQPGFDKINVVHTTNYDYGVNPVSCWKTGYVCVSSLIELPKDTPEDLKTVSLTDLKHQIEYYYPQGDQYDTLAGHLYDGAAQLGAKELLQLDELY